MGAADDRFAIMELLAKYATIPDEKNFDGVFEVFTDTVRWDFESVGDGPATMMTPADIKACCCPVSPGSPRRTTPSRTTESRSTVTTR